MSGFSFPPPPPPPPKASSSTGNNQSGQSGPPGRGRGRGRGRGGQENRGRGGRGGQSFNQRGHHQQGNNYGTPATGLPARPDFNSAGQNGYGGVPTSSTPFNIPTGLPAGAFVNPAFQRQSSSFAAGASTTHQSNVLNHRINPNDAQNGPSRTVAGHKRKLDALRGPQEREKKPAVPTALPIPSFGSPISPPKVTSLPPGPTNALPATSDVQKKRTLGLLPGSTSLQYSASDSEEDDADEESLFAQLGTTLKFEHNGEVMTIDSAADLVAWKKERSKNFPTKDRIAAKMDEKRRLGAERMRLLNEASDALLAVRQRRQSKKPVPETEHEETTPAAPETELEKTKREFAEQTARLEKLRKQVSQSQDRLRAAQVESEERTKFGAGEEDKEAAAQEESEAMQEGQHAGGHAGDHLGDHADEDHEDDDDEIPEDEDDPEEPEIPSDASDVSSVVSSDSNDEASDSDGPPEEASSKAPAGEFGTKRLPCKYFAASGHCKFGDACNFKHERPPGGIREPRPVINRYSKNSQLDDLAVTERKTLYDLLVEKEQEEENKLALRVIKYLGSVNFFAEKTEL